MKKLTLLFAAFCMALSAMAINPYAYGVSIDINATKDTMTLHFSLNADAAAVNGVCYKDGALLGTMPMGAMPKGTYNLPLPVATALGANPDAGVYTFALEVAGVAHDFETYTVTGKSYTGRIHATVDPYPTSAGFGNIYVTSRDGNERGMFYINPGYEYVSTTVERFGLENASWGSCQRGAVAPNGEMWYSSWSDGNSGIHRYDPAAATPAVTQFFLGTRSGTGLITNDGAETGCSTPGIAIYNAGADTKLYMVAEDFTGGNTQGSLAIYNIGQEDGSIVTSWGVAPSAHYNTLTDKAGTNFAMAATPYGAWICQHRAKGSNSAGARSLQFIGNDGVQKFLSTDATMINGSLGGGIVCNAAYDKLYMVNGDGNLMQFSVAWTDGTPALTVDTIYTTPFSGMSQLTFDYAGNLVASVDAGGSYNASSTAMSVAVITLPAAEAPKAETPALGFSYEVEAAPASGCDWDNIAFLGDGAQAGALSNKYKMCVPVESGINVVNIQIAPWDNNNTGIYVNCASADRIACSLAEGQYKIEGAGMLLHLDAFTADYTDFTISYGGNDYDCSVYYVDGTSGTPVVTTHKVTVTVTGQNEDLMDQWAIYSTADDENYTELNTGENDVEEGLKIIFQAIVEEADRFVVVTLDGDTIDTTEGYVIPSLDADANIVVTFGQIPVAEPTYYLVGAGDAFGAWDLAKALPMEGDSIVMGLTAGVYEFKVLVGRAWAGALNAAKVSKTLSSANVRGTDNIHVAVADLCTMKVKVVGDSVVVLGSFLANDPVDVYTVVGDPDLLGSNWDLNDAANEMVENENAFTLVKEHVALVAKSYKWKVVGDHSWTVQFPASGDYNLVIAEAGTYTVTFTLDLAAEVPGNAVAVKEEPVDPTALENIATENVEKFVRDGKIYIRRGEHIYTTSGAMVE